MLIATHTKDSRVACVGFYDCVIHTAHARDFKIVVHGFVQSRDVFQEKGVPRRGPESNTSRHFRVGQQYSEGFRKLP